MGRGGLLLVLAVACWACCASSVAAQSPGGPAGPAGLGVEAGAARGAAPPFAAVLDASSMRWPYAYAPAALFKRLPAQYNFGLGKRVPSKLYSFGIGKRAADYDDDDVEEELVVSDDDADVLDGLVDKRAKAYSFGLGKRAKAYSFGLGKRAKAYSFGLGKRAKAYSFGLGKRLPGGERRYAFGLGKRPDADLDEQLESDETWQSQDSVVGKRELAPQELKEVADEHQHSDAASGGHAATRTKRAAPLQYSFGLGKRFDDEEEDADELLGEDAFGRSARAKQYGFGLGKRFMLRQYDAASAKRGPRQYGFGLGRRSMQYNFGIGKRSGPSEDSATPSPADR